MTGETERGRSYAERRRRKCERLAAIHALVNADPSITTQELARRFGIRPESVARDLRTLNLPTTRRRNSAVRVKHRVARLRRALNENPRLTVDDAARMLNLGRNAAHEALFAARGALRCVSKSAGKRQAAFSLDRARKARELLEANPTLGVKRLARRLGCSAHTARSYMQLARLPSQAVRSPSDLIAFRRAATIVAATPRISSKRLAETVGGITTLQAGAFLRALGCKESQMDKARRLLCLSRGASLDLTLREWAEKYGVPYAVAQRAAKELDVKLARDTRGTHGYDEELETTAKPLPQSVIDEIMREDPRCDPPLLPPDYQERYLKIREARRSGAKKVIARLD